MLENCFISRVPRLLDYFADGTWQFKFVRDELLEKNILRQGWSIEDLRKGFDAYAAAWKKLHRMSGVPKTRFRILAPMLNIAVGDPIVVPKLSVRPADTGIGKYFTIVVCAATYDFSAPANRFASDFRNAVAVEPKRMVTYDFNSEDDNVRLIAEAVSQKGYNPYNFAVHQVEDVAFKQAVEALMP